MEELLGRRVPWSAEAEQAVLGSCLIDPSCLPDVMTAVRGADSAYLCNALALQSIPKLEIASPTT